MIYPGSKRKYAKELSEIMLKDRKEGQYYVEPFVGGCNMIDVVDGNRIGADFNYYLIQCWRALQSGWIPKPYYSESEYLDVIKHKSIEYHDFKIGYVSIVCSYNGIWQGSYSRSYLRPNGTIRCLIKERQRRILKQVPKIRGVQFIYHHYASLDIPDNSIIYCDPPYEKIDRLYKAKFDNEKFWQWCREKACEGHTVFVSEYNAPSDFTCVWEKETYSKIVITKKKKAVEKLFTIKN